jgi:hypothetical protein
MTVADPENCQLLTANSDPVPGSRNKPLATAQLHRIGWRGKNLSTNYTKGHEREPAGVRANGPDGRRALAACASELAPPPDLTALVHLGGRPSRIQEERGEVFAAGRAVRWGGRKLDCGSRGVLSAGSAVAGPAPRLFSCPFV